jgi:hypothetical protein
MEVGLQKQRKGHFWIGFAATSWSFFDREKSIEEVLDDK